MWDIEAAWTLKVALDSARGKGLKISFLQLVVLPIFFLH